MHIGKLSYKALAALYSASGCPDALSTIDLAQTRVRMWKNL